MIGHQLLKRMNLLFAVSVAPGHGNIVVAGFSLVRHSAVKQNPDAVCGVRQADRQFRSRPFPGFGDRGADAVGLLSVLPVDVHEYATVSGKIHHVHGNPIIHAGSQPNARTDETCAGFGGSIADHHRGRTACGMIGRAADLPGKHLPAGRANRKTSFKILRKNRIGDGNGGKYAEAERKQEHRGGEAQQPRGGTTNRSHGFSFQKR